MKIYLNVRDRRRSITAMPTPPIVVLALVDLAVILALAILAPYLGWWALACVPLVIYAAGDLGTCAAELMNRRDRARR